MGLTRIPVKIGRLGSNELYDAKFLVDTGSMDSMAPASELRRVGIEPVGKRVYELANGELEEFEHGIAQISFINENAWTDIIFGPEDTEPILGVITLEIAGYIVDPESQTIRKLVARPLKSKISVAAA